MKKLVNISALIVMLCMCCSLFAGCGKFENKTYIVDDLEITYVTNKKVLGQNLTVTVEVFNIGRERIELKSADFVLKTNDDTMSCIKLTAPTLSVPVSSPDGNMNVYVELNSSLNMNIYYSLYYKNTKVAEFKLICDAIK
jgi:hypothetical protein